MDIEKANAEAVGRMMEARPCWWVWAGEDVIPGMRDNLFLHAGPPITWSECPGRSAGLSWAL